MLGKTNEIAEWEVELAISGPITLGERVVQIMAEKGESKPFTTTISLSKVSQGVRCVLIAKAFNRDNANDVAVYFVGKALDVLSLKLDMPIYLNLFKPDYRQTSSHVRRIVTEQEWQESFSDGRYYSLCRLYLSRAISWYRKGLGSEDPIDRIIAFWSALEAVCSVFHTKNDRTQQGIINQVCDCFDQLWGPCEHWRIIPNNAGVVNKFHEYRNGLSHGFMSVDVDTIRDIVERLPKYQSLVHAFLSDWAQQGAQFESDQPHPPTV